MRLSIPCSLRPLQALALATAFVGVLLAPGAVRAQQCAFGQGAPCGNSEDCADNGSATMCVRGPAGSTCQVPCVDDAGIATPANCSLGETCVPGLEPGLRGGETYYCKASKFSMDLNLLDSCIYHFLEGLVPDLSGQDECSLVQNLSRMLDQDADGDFNIYDVDLCVRAFLQEPPCDRGTASCDDGQLYCDVDADCGTGLHCDDDLNKCVRECGVIVNRAGGTFDQTLDRGCSGRMKTCDYSSGRCVESELEGFSCQVDQDCPSGAYCFLGECAPKCYRSIECPGSDWYCGAQNRCLPRPKVADEEGRPFDPSEYSVHFAAPTIFLDPLNDSYDIPLLIMDQVTKKQVFDRPNAVFGYRLEVEYAVKQDDKCLTDLTKLPFEDKQDCLVSPEDGEAFIRLGSPFGTIYGTGDPTLDVHLDHAAVERLSTGLWQATVSAIFNNGSRTSATVRFRKPSPSGEYTGRMSVYLDDRESLLATSNVSMQLFIDQKAPLITWDALLDDNNITGDREWLDLTQGQPVSGYIHGNDVGILALPSAETLLDNEIPVKGIYSEDTGRLRLIALVDLPAAGNELFGGKALPPGVSAYCKSDNGACGLSDDELSVGNVFGREIRRVIEFIGPYNPQARRFEGVVRETYQGLLPHNLTLDGSFVLVQARQDETPVPLPPLAALPLDVGFPDQDGVLDTVDDAIESACRGSSLSDVRHAASSRDAFQAYMRDVERGACDTNADCAAGLVCASAECLYPCDGTAASCGDRGTCDFHAVPDGVGVYACRPDEPRQHEGPILADMLRFEGRVATALAELDGGSGGALTLREFFRGQIVFCDDPDRDPEAACIPREMVECGVAVYRKAALNGWIDLGTLGVDVDAADEPCRPAPPEGSSPSEHYYANRIPSQSMADHPDSEPVSLPEMPPSLDGQMFGDRVCIAGSLKTSCSTPDGDADPERCAPAACVPQAHCPARRTVLLPPLPLTSPIENEVQEEWFLEPCTGPAGQLCDDGVGEPGPCCRDADTDELFECPESAPLERVQRHFCAMGSLDATLFCDGLPGRTDLCPYTTVNANGVWVLQEHNRFFKELMDTRAFRAGDEVSQAFMTLFYASQGTPLDESTAHAHKELHLARALGHYDAIRDDIFQTDATALLYAWPMTNFKGRGLDWLKQMHSTLNDRMDTLLEMIDLRRRVLRSDNQEDQLFAQHVMQQEYLQQVFLMALQKQWEGDRFAYAGQTEEMMDKGAQLLARANDTRNPLGLHPNRIYFENSDLTKTNWRNFYDRLDQEMEPLENTIHRAVNEMKGALNDSANLGENLLLQQQDLERTLDELCGEPLSLPASCEMTAAEKAELVNEARLNTTSGSEGYGLFEYTCDKGQAGECADVIARFKGASDPDEVACRYDNEPLSISYAGGERLCVRGRMGALRQEEVMLELQRKQVVARVQNLVRRIARQQAHLRETQKGNEELVKYLRRTGAAIGTMESSLQAAEATFEIVKIASKGMNCNLGFSTNCAGSAAEALANSAGAVVYHGVTAAVKIAKTTMLQTKEIRLTENGQQRELRGMRMQLDNMLTEVENHIAEYEAVTQQLFNLKLQMQDVEFQARQAVKRSAEKTSFLVDHLLGRESGSILIRNKLVKEANDKFRLMLVDAYKMTRAFIHRFNVDAEAENWTNRVYQITTAEDLRYFLDFLADIELNYCGAEGLDCDYINNGQVFEFSVQKQLFPHLQDIVDPTTGKVLTVGQQFHNLITSSGYVQRRPRPYGISSQIEIPFAIWLNDRGPSSAAPQRYMVGPGDCNHIIRGTPAQGTIAVNVIGTRLPRSPGVNFELWRGNTDYVRSCTDKVSTYESAVNTYIVGWTPTNALGQLDNPPSFLSQSGELRACINNHLLADPASVDGQEGCFHYFARDRSLGAPDYTLVIPQVDEAQDWVMGDGLDSDEAPIIEDIVLYFRYNDRPITAQN